MTPLLISISSLTKKITAVIFYHLPFILSVYLLTSDTAQNQLDSHEFRILYGLAVLTLLPAYLFVTREFKKSGPSNFRIVKILAKLILTLTILTHILALLSFPILQNTELFKFITILELSFITNYQFQNHFILNDHVSKSKAKQWLSTLSTLSFSFIIITVGTYLFSTKDSELILSLMHVLNIHNALFGIPVILTRVNDHIKQETIPLKKTSEEKITFNSLLLTAAALDNLSSEVCIVDTNGNIISFNKAWKTLFGDTAEYQNITILGANISTIRDSETSENQAQLSNIICGINSVMAGENKEFSSQVILNFSNHQQWFLCRVTHFESELGRHIVIIFEDISELKKKEEELLLKSFAIERANDGIVLTDPTLSDNPIVYVSQGFLKLTGYSEEEVIGKNCRFMQGPESDPNVISKIRTAIANESSFDGEIINYTKEGRPWYNRLKLEPIRNHEGRLIRYVGVQHNVTEAKKLDVERKIALQKEKSARQDAERLYYEAQNANSIKDEFLATLSHELRTPAGVIVGFTELLKYEELSSVEKDEALEALERNARTLVTLIDDMLDMSRAITGKFKLNPKPVDLTSIVESVIAAELLAAQTKNIRIVTEFEPGAGPIFGDTTRLQQIFWNLLSNAIKFTPRNGRVKVSVQTEGSRLIVKVADTGVGIESRFLPHVFERFRQQESGMNRNYGGLGLGLSIVKHLVELHGGSVRADSAGAGRGSTFTVNLPAITSAG